MSSQTDPLSRANLEKAVQHLEGEVRLARYEYEEQLENSRLQSEQERAARDKYLAWKAALAAVHVAMGPPEQPTAPTP